MHTRIFITSITGKIVSYTVDAEETTSQLIERLLPDFKGSSCQNENDYPEKIAADFDLCFSGNAIPHAQAALQLREEDEFYALVFQPERYMARMRALHEATQAGLYAAGIFRHAANPQLEPTVLYSLTTDYAVRKI